MTDFINNSPAHRPTTPPSAALLPNDPPHPLDGEWFIHIEGQTYGPYSGHRLGEFVTEGRVDGATQVLPVGTEEWKRASEDRRLAALFKPSRQANTQAPPPVTAAAGATVVQVTNHMPAQPQFVLMDDGSPFGPKSPGVALLLSFLLCGAGQMYCGRVGKGILMLIGAVVLWFVLLGWIIQIWSMVDAYQTAKKMNLRYLQRLQMGQAV